MMTPIVYLADSALRVCLSSRMVAETPKYSRMERERRYLITDPAWRDAAAPSARRIEDWYLANCRLRLRRLTELDTGREVLKLTKKYGSESSYTQPIVTVLLSAVEYQTFLTLPGYRLEKVRHSLKHQGRVFSVDVFGGPLAGLTLAETNADELEELMSLSVPPFAAREVTEDPWFSGGNLCRVGRAELIDKLEIKEATGSDVERGTGAGASLRVAALPALIIVDLQRGIDDPRWGARNNPDAENNVARLLQAWRRAGGPIYHVRHDSQEPASTYRPGQPGHEFKPGVAPLPGEPVIAKRTPSAFAGTNLEAELRRRGIARVAICGVKSNNSVEATARMAGCLGLQTAVVADATFTFDQVDFSGRHRGADEVHAMALANLAGEYASIVSTSELCAEAERALGCATAF
jgi:nicotinamidase-related amidase/CYTH domain-containing protein